MAFPIINHVLGKSHMFTVVMKDGNIEYVGKYYHELMNLGVYEGFGFTEINLVFIDMLFLFYGGVLVKFLPDTLLVYNPMLFKSLIGFVLERPLYGGSGGSQAVRKSERLNIKKQNNRSNSQLNGKKKGKMIVDEFFAKDGCDAWLSDYQIYEVLKLWVEYKPSIRIIDPIISYREPTQIAQTLCDAMTDGNVEIILLPLCLSDHWILLKIEPDRVIEFDPAGTQMHPKLKSLLKLLEIQESDDGTTKRRRTIRLSDDPQTLQQSDGYNCGPFVLAQAKAWIQKTTFSKKSCPDMGLWRLEIVQDLLKHYECFAKNQEVTSARIKALINERKLTIQAIKQKNQFNNSPKQSQHPTVHSDKIATETARAKTTSYQNGDKIDRTTFMKVYPESKSDLFAEEQLQNNKTSYGILVRVDNVDVRVNCQKSSSVLIDIVNNSVKNGTSVQREVSVDQSKKASVGIDDNEPESDEINSPPYFKKDEQPVCVEEDLKLSSSDRPVVHITKEKYSTDDSCNKIEATRRRSDVDIVDYMPQVKKIRVQQEFAVLNYMVGKDFKDYEEIQSTLHRYGFKSAKSALQIVRLINACKPNKKLFTPIFVFEDNSVEKEFLLWSKSKTASIELWMKNQNLAGGLIREYEIPIEIKETAHPTVYAFYLSAIE